VLLNFFRKNVYGVSITESLLDTYLKPTWSPLDPNWSLIEACLVQILSLIHTWIILESYMNNTRSVLEAGLKYTWSIIEAFFKHTFDQPWNFWAPLILFYCFWTSFYEQMNNIWTELLSILELLSLLKNSSSQAKSAGKRTHFTSKEFLATSISESAKCCNF
jgi:hypothetical protein